LPDHGHHEERRLLAVALKLDDAVALDHSYKVLNGYFSMVRILLSYFLHDNVNLFIMAWQEVIFFKTCIRPIRGKISNSV
jgi:hypothetical protein